MRLLKIRSIDCFWRLLICKMQPLVREHDQDRCRYQNAANYPKRPVARCCRRSGVSRLCWVTDPTSAGEQVDQCDGSLPCLLRKRTARTGEPQEQSGQLLDRISLG
jgi:hypothetical protein